MKSEEIKEQIERLYNNRSLSRFWINIKNGNAVKNFNYQRWQRFIKLYLFSIVSYRDATCGIVVNPRVGGIRAKLSSFNKPRHPFSLRGSQRGRILQEVVLDASFLDRETSR